MGLRAKPVPPVKPPSGQADELTRIQVDVTRVNMLFTVTDKRGRFVTSLNKDDFEVLDRKKPQVIQEFMAEADLPLRLAVLVDTSNSIRDRFRFEQEAASEFVKSVLKSNADKAMIVSFDTQAELVAVPVRPALLHRQQGAQHPAAAAGDRPRLDAQRVRARRTRRSR